MQEQSSAEYIRKLKAKIASLPRKERIKRLEHERHNSPNRTVAKHLDELIREERGGYRRRVTLKLAGWAVILAAIFYVLIAFGQPHPQKQVADAGSRSSKVQKPSTSHKKHQAKQKAKQKAKKHKASSSSSSSVAASSSSSYSVSAAATSSSTVSATSRVASSSQVQSSSSSAVQRASASSSTRRATQTQTQTQTQRAQTTQTQQTTRSSQTSTYTIQNGDNMYRIAVNHGMTLSELQALNGMGSSTSLTPGQTIRVR
jgi:LysM repeat protein